MSLTYKEIEDSCRCQKCVWVMQRVMQLRGLLTKMGLDLWIFASMVSRTRKSDAWGNCVDEANKILKTEKGNDEKTIGS